MSTTLTDSQVIAGLRSNDSRFSQTVCKHLFEKFHNPLVYFAQAIIRDQEEARDIYLTTFNKFWSLRNNFDAENNIKAFLYITVRNSCFNYLRAKNRFNEIRQEALEGMQMGTLQNETERLIIESDFIKRVYQEIQKLPLRRREIFILSYFKGLKANEIAEKLNISKSAVTTQRSLAIQQLRQALSGDVYLILGLFSTILSI